MPPLAAAFSRASSSSGAGASINATSKNSSKLATPSDSAGPNDISGLGWKPLLYAVRVPARRTMRGNSRIRSKCPSSAAGPVLLKFSRKRCGSPPERTGRNASGRLRGFFFCFFEADPAATAAASGTASNANGSGADSSKMGAHGFGRQHG